MAMYLVMFRPSFENNESLALVGTVVGYLSAKADTIIGWYFGSSQKLHGEDRYYGEVVKR